MEARQGATLALRREASPVSWPSAAGTVAGPLLLLCRSYFFLEEVVELTVVALERTQRKPM
jgi:hypothetical protein